MILVLNEFFFLVLIPFKFSIIFHGTKSTWRVVLVIQGIIVVMMTKTAGPKGILNIIYNLCEVQLLVLKRF